MRRYYLHTRYNGIFYAELVNPITGGKLAARSTGTRNRDEALLAVAKWLETGIPTGRARKPRTLETAAGIENVLKAVRKTDLNPDDALRIVTALKDRGLIDIAAVKSGKGAVSFTEFLEEFWDYTASPYVREKLAHGHSLGKRHCYESMSRFSRYWKPAFQGRRLDSITRKDLRDFSLGLAEGGLAPASINKIMATGTTCLSWAFREGMIPADPTVGLVNFSGEAKKRGVLTPLEVQALFAAFWKDKRAYTASILACTTGMRSGEVLALHKSDIEEKTLNIRHSWSDFDGLKTPKNGESRRVPLLPEVREKLLALAGENPHGPEGFIFYGLLKDKPIDRSILLNGLHDALTAIGIDAAGRGIVFHSWRHYYAARMADRMTADQVSRITGHKSKAVFEKYADHLIAENLEAAGAIGAEVFRNVLSFRKGA
ncbi:MAG: tyrosine-type recombinase/integrase [Treponema sp.]|jgi:integrase|nr:tyrosine-type recombinase/integrase [Treponema sp.]